MKKKHQTRITSLIAYQEALCHIGEHQKQVLIVIRFSKSINNRMIAEKLGWPINSVTPRVNELRNNKIRGKPCPLVCVAYTAQDPLTKRQTIFWRSTEKGLW